MRRRTLPCLILTLGLCWTTAGCGGLTLGPRVETRYVIVETGAPCQVLENKTVKVRALKGEGDPVQQDIGGWVAMPESHWKKIKQVLEER